MSAADMLESARTALFVPADRPERFAKAAGSGADLVLLDLEDAVAPDAKVAAREHAADWLTSHHAGVRVNAPGTTWFGDDLEAVSAGPRVVMVPKAESPEILHEIADRLAPGSVVLALVETAAGVVRAADIAATPGVARLAFGSYDLATELGVSPDDREAMAWSRGALVLASAAAGLPAPLDGVTGDVTDEAALRDNMEAAARLGFSGKLCIHPRQVAPVHDALAPAPYEVAWARRVLAADCTGGVTVVDGKMVDTPVVERARRLLASAGRGAGTGSTREEPT